ncbi:MAG: hypothetical protein ACYC91_19060 [Solirubrobacteraceae bacterium]
MEIISAPDVFDDPLQPGLEPCSVAIVRWGKDRLTSNGGQLFVEATEPVTVGTECEPHESIGGVTWESSGLVISAPTFGNVHRLLVSDGDEVVPGQPLLEFEDRSPTYDEWYKEWMRAYDAEGRCHELERMLATPWRAIGASLANSWKRWRGW